MHLFIFTGIFGVPKELCAQEYVHAVKQYSSSRGKFSLLEVHFVDKDVEMVELIRQTFVKDVN